MASRDYRMMMRVLLIAMGVRFGGSKFLCLGCGLENTRHRLGFG
jgi:hypothetical protein